MSAKRIEPTQPSPDLKTPESGRMYDRAAISETIVNVNRNGARNDSDRSSVLVEWAFRNSSDGILITDLEGRIKLVNDAFCNLFGYSREEVVGLRTGFLRSPHSTQEFYAEMWRSLKEHGEWKGEIVNLRKDGKLISCFLTITPIISDEGERLGFLGVEIDLTERKRLEAEVAQGEKLAAIGESVATLAHEIRNPLNGISMNVYMLERAAEQSSHWTEAEKESVHLIGAETKRLDRLVRNVLTYARTAELRRERVLVNELLEDAKQLVVHLADQLGVEIKLKHTPEHVTLNCDQDMMKQVLLNLLRNAIEVSGASQSDKTISITAGEEAGAKWHSVSPSGRVVLINVDDTGPGVPAEVRRQLFKPFFTTKEQGLGLGLATSAKIIRQHSGIIEVTDAPDKRYKTRFTVALPA